MKIKIIDDLDFENMMNDNPVFLLSADGTYMLESSFEEIKDTLAAEGYDIRRIAAPQHILMKNLKEKMNKR